MKPHALVSLPLVAVLAWPGEVYAQRPAKTGAFEIGGRAGLEFPVGRRFENSEDISYSWPTGFPLWLDLGYRYRGNWLFGGFAMFAPVSTANCPASSCSATHVRIGGQVHYHFAPENKIDGFIGGGLSYEWLAFTASGFTDTSVTLGGFEWLHIQGGADFKVSDKVAIGPFGAIFFGQYSSYKVRDRFATAEPRIDGSLHQWLMIGFRVVADL